MDKHEYSVLPVDLASISISMSMHPRNLYRNPLDFNELGDAYIELKPYLTVDPVSRRATLDFKDEEAQRRLSEALMFRDFGVRLHIPLTRLCPPIPNRLNYALWIQDIVRAHEQVIGVLSRPIRGIDIGTGATTIYPFLICKLEPSWTMIATELDEESFASASSNVAHNQMASQIIVRKASVDGMILFPLEDRSGESFEFTMCNPPFYGSEDEIAQSASQKDQPPNAVCTGADVEMIYSDGGEEGFVGKMLEESVQFQTRCKWYTSMLGKMSSVLTIVEKLRQLKITNYGVVEFVQGQTRRWAVAWSFTDFRHPDNLSRIQSISSKHPLFSIMPPKNTLVQPLSQCTFKQACLSLSQILHSVENTSVAAVKPPMSTGLDDSQPEQELFAAGVNEPPALFFIEAEGNTWSRSARRNRSKRQSGITLDTSSTATSKPALTTISDSKPALTCSCRIIGSAEGTSSSEDAASDNPGYAVEFQWIFGEDRSLFESFVGHVSRKVIASLVAENT